MAYTMHKAIAACWVCWALSLPGCGGGLDLAEVSGTVTFDGKPLADAAVLFQPVEAGPVAAGHTDEAGRFHLTTAAQPGAAPGRYRVAVNKSVLHGVNSDGTAATGGVTTEWITPQRYSMPEQSGLEADVTSSGNEFLFRLTAN